jgi:replicative DNA helicase
MKFVAGTLKNKWNMQRVYLNFDSNVLSSDLVKHIYDKAVALWQDDNVLLDDIAFKNMLDTEHSHRDKLTVMWKRIRKLGRDMTLAATVSAMKKLKILYEGRVISICVNETIGDLGKGLKGDLKALTVARERLVSFNDLSASKDFKVDRGDPREGYKHFKQHFIHIQKNPGSVGGTPTGITEIDSQMIGLRSGEFGLVSGPTGSGKSIMLLDFATYCWQTTGDVVVVTIEMPKEQYYMRWYCRMSGIPYEYFRRYALTKDQWNKLDEAVEKSKSNKNRFEVIDMPEGCTVKAVKAAVKSYFNKSNVKMCGIDYLNIMTCKSGDINMAWESQLDLAVQLKLHIARGLNMPTWSLVQTGKDEIAFSTHIKDQVDVALLIQPDENTLETGIINMKWLKTRDFRGKPFTLSTSMDRMRFSSVPENEKHEYKKLNTQTKVRT